MLSRRVPAGMANVPRRLVPSRPRTAKREPSKLPDTSRSSPASYVPIRCSIPSSPARGTPTSADAPLVVTFTSNAASSPGSAVSGTTGCVAGGSPRVSMRSTSKSAEIVPAAFSDRSVSANPCGTAASSASSSGASANCGSSCQTSPPLTPAPSSPKPEMASRAGGVPSPVGCSAVSPSSSMRPGTMRSVPYTCSRS